MDTNWNSTDKDPGGALEQFVAEEVREGSFLAILQVLQCTFLIFHVF